VRRISLAACAAVALPLIIPVTAQPACGTSAGFTLPDRGRTRDVRSVGQALAFTSGLRVNTDGAPNSYHPEGTSKGALNTICNAIAITPRSGPFAGQRITALSPTSLTGRERCRMILDVFSKSMNAAFAIPPDAEIDWFAIASRAPQDGKYRPCIQQAGPFTGFFVAQTSRAADPTKDICDPAHWISSTDIPYITLPGNRLRSKGVTPGDLALVHRRHQGVDQIVVAVAADTGNANELGEGSIALHKALGNQAAARLPGNIGDGVTTFIFPGRRATQPIVAPTLAAERAALLAAVGGETAVRACAPS
jgi:hypothetical protein